MENLRKVGALKSQGEFSLDLARADSKLARFQFRQEKDFLYQMVGGLYRLGASALEVRVQGSHLQVTLSGSLKVPENLPRDLGICVLEESSPWRRLAAASLALAAHSPTRYEWLGRAREQRYDCLKSQGQRWKGVELAEISADGLPAQLLEQALSELRQRALPCRRPLSIQGDNFQDLSRDLRPIGAFVGSCSCRAGQTFSSLHLVVDEMLSEPKFLDLPIPWSGTIYWDLPQVNWDASLANLVEDQHYQRLLAAIPTTFGSCLQALRVQAHQPEVAELFLRLMAEVSPWLDELRPTYLELFRDHLGLSWSLEGLQRHAELRRETIYYTSQPLSLKLPQIILVDCSPTALKCLYKHLGEVQEATPLVLRQLVRQANYRHWSQQPATGLQLPAMVWISRLDQPGLSLGAPDDWSSSGGQVNLVHEGRPLARRHWPHSDWTFVLVYEVEEKDIDELWADITEEAWQSLTSKCQPLVQQLMQGLSARGEELRSHLLRSLARLPRPEQGYFASTLLFRDWSGGLHSLVDLLQASGQGIKVGIVGAQQQPPPGWHKTFLPRALVLQTPPEVADFLRKIKALKLREFSVWLKDFESSRQAALHPNPLDSPWTIAWKTPQYEASLQLTPNFDQGEVELFYRGVKLRNEKLESLLGFRAQIHTQQLPIQALTANYGLGACRFEVRKTAAWRRCQKDLLNRTQESLEQLKPCLSGLPDWQNWLRQAVLRGIQLSEYALLDGLPNPHRLQTLLQAPCIAWCSQTPNPEVARDYQEKNPQIPLVCPLSPAEQKALQNHFGGVWDCQDEAFADSLKLREFLQRPLVSYAPRPDARVSWPARPPLQGLIQLTEKSEGSSVIHWHHRQRLVCEEYLFYGFLMQLECDQLLPNSNYSQLGPPEVRQQLRQEALRQLAAALADWLQEPRKCHLPYENLIQLGPEVERGLRRQKLFFTLQGCQSWDDLMQAETLYFLPRDHKGSYSRHPALADLSVVEGYGAWELLKKAHPKVVDGQATLELLAERVERHQLLTTLSGQMLRLTLATHSCPLTPPCQGQLAYSGLPGQDCWVVSRESALLIQNLPEGFSGYAITDDYTEIQLGEQTQARLGEASQQAFLEAALEVALQRIRVGKLKACEREVLAALGLYLLAYPPHHEPWVAYWKSRWIPCADGTLTSPHQLRQQVAEQGALEYWEMRYPLTAGSHLTPILATPLQLELTTRFCGHAPTRKPKPLLLRSTRELLQGLGQWWSSRRSRPSPLTPSESHSNRAAPASLVQALTARAQTSEPQQGANLQAALIRIARQTLTDLARQETLTRLESAEWTWQRSPTQAWSWNRDGKLLLAGRHPLLQPWALQEPPPPILLSLFLGLVAQINARSPQFTDPMERQFLTTLTSEIADTYRDQTSPS